MRFVRHSTISEWGLGVVAADDNSNLDILFEGIGYKKVAKAFRGLIELADEAVPADHPLRKREDWPKVERDGKRASMTVAENSPSGTVVTLTVPYQSQVREGEAA